MVRFRQTKTLQKFASVHANVHTHFSLERHLTDCKTYKERRSVALAEWQSGRVAEWQILFLQARLSSSKTEEHPVDSSSR